MLRTRGCDRLACAVMLRVLIVDDSAFDEDPRLRGTTALFDRTLSSSLYPAAGLEKKSQAFEKKDQLRTLVTEHEGRLLSHLSGLSSLEAMEAFRRDFGQLFRAPSTRAFVIPFLPATITAQSFEALLSAAQSLGDCADASLVSHSEALNRRCDEMREVAEEFGTDYAGVLLGDFATKLQVLVDEKVNDSGFTDPANLSIALRPKRYPFGHPTVPVTVRLDLSNMGPGQAQDISVRVEGGGAISFDETVRNIGLLGPSSRQIDFQGLVAGGRGRVDEELLGVYVTWRNPDGTEQELEDVFTLRAQRADVPWDDLELERPYRLEPITDRKDFVGRSSAVHDLVRVVLESGNARIEGEKRVGKTSLANAVKAAVEDRDPGRYVFLQLESGDFSAHTLEATIARMGKLIAERVQRSDRRLAELDIPDFSPGLTMLTEFFARAEELADDLRFVIVLDEFDALPHEALYRHEPVGDAFFQTLRSLGGKSNVGFLLIGAERMQWVIATHGQALNRFKLVRLDYFSADQISEYASLVRDPVADWLHFSEEAIDALHEASAGNPWMTKLLLRELFERQVERRDQDIQVDDVYEAIEHALPSFGITSFQHFWDDAIRGEMEHREHVSAMRRRVLLGLARSLQGKREAEETDVLEEARSFSVDETTAQEMIREFLDRKILVKKGTFLTCRVPLFERWLARFGTQEIILGTGGEDALLKRQLAVEKLRPTVEEMERLAGEWKSYRGKEIRPEGILSWLEQFGGPEEQRLVVPILEGLRFYTRTKIDESLRGLHEYLVRELASRGYQFKLSGQQRNRSDLLVCGLEGGGSGATHLLKQYREENGIYKNCVVDASSVREALRTAKKPIRAVIIVEDFMGTGNTADGRLRELYEMWTSDEAWPSDVDVFLLTITAFDSAVKMLEEGVQQLDWPFTIHVRDMLEDEDRCFHEDSRFYSDAGKRGAARALCERYGSLLTDRGPLGYGKTEAAVCFEYRCPNNTLPVLWGSGENWKPLFPRIT